MKKQKLNKVKKALEEEKGTGSPYDGYSIKDYKRDNKNAKVSRKKEIKKALKEEKGTGSKYDGMKYKDFKKKPGTGNHPRNR